MCCFISFDPGQLSARCCSPLKDVLASSTVRFEFDACPCRLQTQMKCTDLHSLALSLTNSVSPSDLLVFCSIPCSKVILDGLQFLFCGCSRGSELSNFLTGAFVQQLPFGSRPSESSVASCGAAHVHSGLRWRM